VSLSKFQVLATHCQGTVTNGHIATAKTPAVLLSLKHYRSVWTYNWTRAWLLMFYHLWMTHLVTIRVKGQVYRAEVLNICSTERTPRSWGPTNSDKDLTENSSLKNMSLN